MDIRAGTYKKGDRWAGEQDGKRFKGKHRKPRMASVAEIKELWRYFEAYIKAGV